MIICKPIIASLRTAVGLFWDTVCQKKQERKRIMGKKRVFAALLALAVTVGSLHCRPGGLYRYDGPLGGDRHHEME